MRRLFDDPTDHITVREAYDVPRPRPAARPWLGVCMVASIDGSTVIDSNSRGLSSKTDQEVLLTLRDLADVLIVGAATVRIEGYGPPRKQGQRVGVVSRRGDVDADERRCSPAGPGFLILPDRRSADVGRFDSRGNRRGRSRRCAGQLDADFVQAEGGALLNGALSAADLIDEMNLTISPQLAGGDGPRVTSGSMPRSRVRCASAHVLEDDGFLFTRYLRAR